MAGITRRRATVMRQSVAPPTGETPMRVGALYKTLGVNIHPELGGAYATGANVLARINDIGARSARTALGGSGPAVNQALVTGGIGLSIVPTTAPANVTTTVNNLVTVAGYSGWVAGMLFAVEGPPQPNNYPMQYPTGVYSDFDNPEPEGFRPIANWMRDLYAGVKANSTLTGKAIQVWHGAMGGGGQPDNAGLQWLTVPAGAGSSRNTNAARSSGNTLPFANTSGIHIGSYVYGTNVPAGATVTARGATSVTLSSSILGSIPSGTAIRFGCKVPDGTITGEACAVHAFPTLAGLSPQMVNENDGDLWDGYLTDEYVTTWHAGYTGYASLATANQQRRVCTEFGIPTGTTAANSTSVAQTTAGKCLINGWLSAVLKGYEFVFIHELYNNTSDNFGLFNSDQSTRSPGLYFKNLASIIGDTTGTRDTFAVTPAEYSLTNMPATAQKLQVQRSNGDRFLLVWNNRDNWDTAAGAAISITGTTVTLTTPTSKTFSHYNPTIGTTVQATNTGTSTTFSLTDHAVAIKIA